MWLCGERAAIRVQTNATLGPQFQIRNKIHTFFSQTNPAGYQNSHIQAHRLRIVPWLCVLVGWWACWKNATEQKIIHDIETDIVYTKNTTSQIIDVRLSIRSSHVQQTPAGYQVSHIEPLFCAYSRNCGCLLLTSSLQTAVNIRSTILKHKVRQCQQSIPISTNT